MSRRSSRRTFLQQSALASVGFWVAGGVTLGDSKSPNEKINIAMIALAEWIAPNFSIDGFWTYVGIVVIVWLVNWIGGRVLDESERRPALRRI